MGIRLDPEAARCCSHKGRQRRNRHYQHGKVDEALPENDQGDHGDLRVSNASIIIRDDISDDQLIDVMAGIDVCPSLTVLNKVTWSTRNTLVPQRSNWQLCSIVAEKDVNMEILRDRIWRRLILSGST